jgi:hypothetical protein
MIASAFTALLLGSQLTINVVADTVPKLDVGPTCREESAAIQSDAQSCMKDEQDAREQLVKQWTQFHSADKSTCVGLTETGGSSSYVELLTCLEMSSDARKSPAE